MEAYNRNGFGLDRNCWMISINDDEGFVKQLNEGLRWYLKGTLSELSVFFAPFLHPAGDLSQVLEPLPQFL